MAEEFPFADQLKSEFRGRGAAVSGIRATSTEELMHRAEMGKDPHVNVSEEAFRENYQAKQDADRTAPSRPPQNGGNAQGRTGDPNGNPNAGKRRMNGNQQSDGRTPENRADRRQTGSRPQGRDPSRSASLQSGDGRVGERRQNGGGGDGFERDRLSEEIAGRGRARMKSGSRGGQSEVKKASRTAERKPKLRVTQTRAARRKAAAGGVGTAEIEMRRTAFPVTLIALCLIAAALIFSVVGSLARVYQANSEIRRMNTTLDELKDTAAGLVLKLDEKNDIRTIREIASGELGMAEEDSMQRRFVSVSGGERIEILETEDGEGTAGGVLFSSLGDSIARFADRFR